MRDDAPDLAAMRLTARDWVLGVLTLPLLLFALMIVTSAAADALVRPRFRLRLYLVLLFLEAIGGAIIAWLVVR